MASGLADGRIADGSSRLERIEIGVLALILVLANQGKACCAQLATVFVGAERTRLQSRHRVVPTNGVASDVNKNLPPGTSMSATLFDQTPLLLRREQEDQPPGEDAVKVPMEESRVLDGLADDGGVWQIATEGLDERWCRINAIHAQSFGD